MGLRINGERPVDVKVNGTSVEKVLKNGTKVWPDSLTEMTAGFSSSLGEYGFLQQTYGSISGDTSVEGASINAVRWQDSVNSLYFSLEGTLPQDYFAFSVLETDQGKQEFYTSQADGFTQGSNQTTWRYNKSTNPFTDGNSYTVKWIT